MWYFMSMIAEARYSVVANPWLKVEAALILAITSRLPFPTSERSVEASKVPWICDCLAAQPKPPRAPLACSNSSAVSFASNFRVVGVTSWRFDT